VQTIEPDSDLIFGEDIQRRCREAPLGTKVNSRILVSFFECSDCLWNVWSPSAGNNVVARYSVTVCTCNELHLRCPKTCWSPIHTYWTASVSFSHTENSDRLMRLMARLRISTASIENSTPHPLHRLSLSLFFQASDITGGIYIKTPEPAGLLQFLIVSFSTLKRGYYPKNNGYIHLSSYNIECCGIAPIPLTMM
jgi:hypothetical protein